MNPFMPSAIAVRRGPIKLRLLEAALVLAAALPGCTWTRVHGDERPPPPAHAVDPALFDYAAPSAPPERVGSAREGSTEVETLRFAATPGARFEALTAHAYRPEGTGAGPSVLVFPILGGEYEVSTMFARWLADQGYAVLRFERPRPPLEPVGDLAAVRDYLIEATREARRALDWWRTQPRVDPERVGVLGISLGSLVGTLFLAHEPRVRVGALLIGGSDIARVLRDADEAEIVAFRRPFLEERDLSPDAFYAQATEALADVEPLHHAGRLDPARILMVSGRFDAVAPFAGASAFWEAAGRPDRMIYPAGHYSAILFLRDIEAAVLAHFRRHL